MRGRWFTRLGLPLLSVLLSGLVLELGLRVVGFSRPSFYAADEIVGARLRPGAEGIDDREGGAFVRISGQGLRDREHSTKAAPNTLRIAILGDSFSEALQVDEEETYWRRTETMLRNCAGLRGRTPEVLNFGVSGYGTAQELLTLDHFVRPFAPEIVVLQAFLTNDLRDNVPELSNEPARPFFRLEDGKLALDRSFTSHPRYRFRAGRMARWGYSWVNASRVLQLLNAAKNALRRPGRAAPSTGPVTDPVYRDVDSPVWRRAWAVTEALIEATHRKSSEMGARFVLMTVSDPPQVHPDAAYRQQFARARGVADLFHPERRLARLARQKGIAYLPTSVTLQAAADRTGTYFHGFESSGTLGEGHWNEAGHARAGELLADLLCRTLTSSAAVVAVPAGL